MPLKNKTILVTTALPYANGALHLGHILEQVQADIWVRFHRLQGHEIYFMCADDAHGVSVMLQAQHLGITPEKLAACMQAEHIADSKKFSISFDHYYSTNSSENHYLLENIYHTLQQNKLIIYKKIEQLYDTQQQQFLPDRFVTGICPRCRAPNQYGDNCEQCGSVYAAKDLLEPRSRLTGIVPILKESKHFFFDLPSMAKWLQQWISSGTLDAPIVNKLQEWFRDGLQPWDITRDAPYFGFPIPGIADKYFYVWLDAPIGYMATMKNYCKHNPHLCFDEFWHPDTISELYHFIGKDITYFHALFWPAILRGANLRTPTKIFVHGFLTINGEKMSKSKGTFILARQYSQHLPSDALRYYYATKLSSGIHDIDLNLSDFMRRCNSDIVNKLINLAARCAKFIEKEFSGQLSATWNCQKIYHIITGAAPIIATAYSCLDYSKAMRHIMQLTDQVNYYINQQAPWSLINQEKQRDKVQEICSIGINCFRVLMTYIQPVMPTLAEQAENFLSTKLTWRSIEFPMLKHKINPFKPLFKRIELQQINQLLRVSKNMKQCDIPAESKTKQPDIITPAPGYNKNTDAISIDVLNKIDLRVALVVHAEQVPQADKLLKLIVDLGQEQRQIFAGIKMAYTPENLIGKLVVVVANLAPREMRFGTSEAMLLAAGNGGTEIFLLQPDKGAIPGMPVK